jgi:hypothetical protein
MTIWFLSDEFLNLTVGGKVAVVASYILAMLLIMLWATFPTRKRDVKTLPMNTTYSTEQPIEKPKNCTSNCYENENLQKPEEGGIIGSGLLSKLPNGIKKWCVYYSANEDRQNPKQHFLWSIINSIGRARTTCIFSRWHIKYIVNKLQRRVNQSGKEPSVN